MNPTVQTSIRKCLYLILVHRSAFEFNETTPIWTYGHKQDIHWLRCQIKWEKLWNQLTSLDFNRKSQKQLVQFTILWHWLWTCMTHRLHITKANSKTVTGRWATADRLALQAECASLELRRQMMGIICGTDSILLFLPFISALIMWNRSLPLSSLSGILPHGPELLFLYCSFRKSYTGEILLYLGDGSHHVRSSCWAGTFQQSQLISVILHNEQTLFNEMQTVVKLCCFHICVQSLVDF